MSRKNKGKRRARRKKPSQSAPVNQGEQVNKEELPLARGHSKWLMGLMVGLLLLGVILVFGGAGPKVGSTKTVEAPKPTEPIKASTPEINRPVEYEKLVAYDHLVQAWVDDAHKLLKKSKDPQVRSFLEPFEQRLFTTVSALRASGGTVNFFQEGLTSSRQGKILIIAVPKSSPVWKERGLSDTSIAMYSAGSDLIYVSAETEGSFLRGVCFIHELFHLFEHIRGSLNTNDNSVISYVRSEEAAWFLTKFVVDTGCDGAYTRVLDSLLGTGKVYLKGPLSYEETDKINQAIGYKPESRFADNLLAGFHKSNLNFHRGWRQYPYQNMFHRRLKAFKDMMVPLGYNLHEKFPLIVEDELKALDLYVHIEEVLVKNVDPNAAILPPEIKTLVEQAVVLAPEYEWGWQLLTRDAEAQIIEGFKKKPGELGSAPIELRQVFLKASLNWCRLRPDSIDAYAYASTAYARFHRFEEAIALINKGLVKNPNNPRLTEHLAKLQAVKQEVESK